MRTYRNCYMLFLASFKLALMCCSCLHHLLPWVASCSLVMHHACCASCLVHVWCVYHVVCFFSIVPVSLRSWGFVRLRLVRLHPFVFLMDSFFFIAGFQARWPYPRNHFYLCFASCSLYCHAPLPTTCYIMPPILPCQPLTFSPFLANRCLAILPAFAQPLL